MILIKNAGDFTPSVCRDLWDYDPISGDITWKEVPERYFLDCKNSYKRMLKWNKDHHGKVATRKCRTVNYVTLKVRFREVSANAHRVAWMVHTGNFPPKTIDHKNRNACDNSWGNLRDGEGGVNSINRSRSISNSSGIAGVRWDTANQLWKCELRGTFLGRYATLLDAASAVFRHSRAIGVTRDQLVNIAWYHE